MAGQRVRWNYEAPIGYTDGGGVQDLITIHWLYLNIYFRYFKYFKSLPRSIFPTFPLDCFRVLPHPDNSSIDVGGVHPSLCHCNSALEKSLLCPPPPWCSFFREEWPFHKRPPRSVRLPGRGSSSKQKRFGPTNCLKKQLLLVFAVKMLLLCQQIRYCQR